MLDDHQSQNAHSLLQVDTAFTFDEMLRLATHAFGDIGKRTALLWREYNSKYFDDVLNPIPLVYVPTLPHGAHVGETWQTHVIYLMGQGPRRPWSFIRGVLVHEMLHQFLYQRGVSASHDSDGWRTEIMRITAKHFGKEIWAGRIKVTKVGKGKDRRSVKFNAPHPDGRKSLTQGEIARWPHSVGIVPPDLTGAAE